MLLLLTEESEDWRGSVSEPCRWEKRLICLLHKSPETADVWLSWQFWRVVNKIKQAFLKKLFVIKRKKIYASTKKNDKLHLMKMKLLLFFLFFYCQFRSFDIISQNSKRAHRHLQSRESAHVFWTKGRSNWLEVDLQMLVTSETLQYSKHSPQCAVDHLLAKCEDHTNINNSQTCHMCSYKSQAIDNKWYRMWSGPEFQQ